MPIIRTRHAFNRRNAVARPAWVPAFCTVAIDFARNRGYGGLREMFFSPLLTCTRASTADYVDDLRGLYSVVPAATPRISNRGLLIEGAATNVVIRNRDLTQAAWVPVNMTAAMDQVGVDGVANSASSIVSTSGNATILQTDVLGSSSRRASAFVKRITGSGTINMTTDGSTWTAVTVTSDWTRVNIAAQTVVNPVTGFQIVTSGDKIAVDLVQNETGPSVTSPIATGAASVARSADIVKFSFVPQFYNPLEGFLYAEAYLNQVNTGVVQSIVVFDDTTAANRIGIRESGARANGIVSVGSATQANPVSAANTVANAVAKCVMGYQVNNFNVAYAGTNGAVDTSGSLPGSAVTQLVFGSNAGQPLNGYIRMFAYSPIRPPDLVLASLTIGTGLQ